MGFDWCCFYHSIRKSQREAKSRFAWEKVICLFDPQSDPYPVTLDSIIKNEAGGGGDNFEKHAEPRDLKKNLNRRKFQKNACSKTTQMEKKIHVFANRTLSCSQTISYNSIKRNWTFKELLLLLKKASISKEFRWQLESVIYIHRCYVIEYPTFQKTQIFTGRTPAMESGKYFQWPGVSRWK